MPFLLWSTRPITWNKISGGKKISHFAIDHQFSLSLSLPLSLSPPPLSLSLPALSLCLPPPTLTQSVGLLKKISFKWWFDGWDGVGWLDFVRENVPDCWRSIRKWPLTKRVCAYSGNTENGSIGRWSKLAGWLINSQEFSQVVRSSWVEAIITERREEMSVQDVAFFWYGWACIFN